MRTNELPREPTPPVPPEIEGFLKKLKRKTKRLAGNWNKRWFFVDPRRREFGYADNRTSAPRSSIFLDDITAVVQFDETHFQVESRTRNFFLCGESKASTACWVTSLEGYRKKVIEYEKDKIAYATAIATVTAKASAAALSVNSPQQSLSPTAARERRNNKKTRNSPGADDREPVSTSSSLSCTSSTTSISSKSKRESGKAEHSQADRLPPRIEQRCASPLAIDTKRVSSRGKNRSPSPLSSDGEKANRDRHRDRERGRDRDRTRKFDKRESSHDRDQVRNSEHNRSRDRFTRAPSGRGPVMQAWVDDF